MGINICGFGARQNNYFDFDGSNRIETNLSKIEKYSYLKETQNISITSEDLRTKSVDQLNADLVEAKKELFNLRFQNATNQLDNTSRIKDVRRNIARIQTVIVEKENA